MRILAIGDIVGEESLSLVERRLFALRRDEKIDFCIANGENCARTNGIDEPCAMRLLRAGVDVITGGNHTWQGKNVSDLLFENENVIRPANYPGDAPGEGYIIFDTGSCRILVMNLIGTVFMDSFDNPFYCAKAILEKESSKYDFAVVDFHAEATSEKAALAEYIASLNMRVAAFFGTHTHVVTADERIIGKKMGFITDIGMCAFVGSVLGMDTERAITRFLTKRNVPYRAAEAGEWRGNGVIFEVNEKSAECTSVKRIVF